MAVSKDNLSDINPPSNVSSISMQQNSSSPAQLDGFLNLLADLNIFTQDNFSEKSISNPDVIDNLQHLENISETFITTNTEAAIINENSPGNFTNQSIILTEDLQLTNIPAEDIDKRSPIISEQDSEEILNKLQNLLMDSSTSSLHYLEGSSPAQISRNTSKIAVVNELKPETEIDAFKKLQSLLVGSSVADVRTLIAYINQKVENIERQIYEPQELINLILPLIAEILSIKVVESREEIAKAISPVMNDMIQAKTEENKEAMIEAIAPLLPGAIMKQVNNFPGEFAKALGPEMGAAIKEQIELERDAMVDALYPVIGNTIAKYMAEALRNINQQVENAFSMEGVQRKFRAKMQGVSEAELILKEAIPFVVQAIFLIHKGSGLVICDIQQDGNERLESEMVAGMLTAIRSFVNDCIAQSGTVSELDQIDYGNSKIILEVAGYCYLAIVVQGEPPKWFINNMRRAMSTIVEVYGKDIQLFEGDTSSIPEEVTSLLKGIRDSTLKNKSSQSNSLLKLILFILAIILIPWSFFQYRHNIEQQIEADTAQALASSPELAVYRLQVDVHDQSLKLSGKVPNQYLRHKAAQIAHEIAPKQSLDNKIIAVQIPADPVLTAAEVKRVTAFLNQIDGVVIVAKYDTTGKVIVKGSVMQDTDAQKITQAFAKIPGVEKVTNTVQLNSLRLPIRIYFDLGSAKLKPKDMNTKIINIKEFLHKYPSKHLKIIGHSDYSGNSAQNQKLAIDRAKAVKAALIAHSIDPKRLQILGTTTPSPGIDLHQPLWFSRYVEFAPITPGLIRK